MISDEFEYNGQFDTVEKMLIGFLESSADDVGKHIILQRLARFYANHHRLADDIYAIG